LSFASSGTGSIEAGEVTVKAYATAEVIDPAMIVLYLLGDTRVEVFLLFSIEKYSLGREENAPNLLKARRKEERIGEKKRREAREV
jgi:hypothetical protein